jgi:hypothetical protein
MDSEKEKIAKGESDQQSGPVAVPLNPWDLTASGKLKSEAKLEKTPYEIWFERKKEESGTEITCPQCGAVNKLMPNVINEKCDSCGYEFYEDGQNILTDMAEHDRKIGKDSIGRMYLESAKGLRTHLLLPSQITEHEDVALHLMFRSYVWLFYLVLSIVSVWLFLPILKNIPQGKISFWVVINLLWWVLVILFSIAGLIRTLRITSIETNNESVVFRGMIGAVMLKFDKMINIQNDRQLNSAGRILDMLDRNFLFAWLSLGSYINEASGSVLYVNHVSISSVEQSVDLSFSGGEQQSYIRAMATIIYMSRLTSHKCMISESAIKSAEKGRGDYEDWLGDKFDKSQ